MPDVLLLIVAQLMIFFEFKKKYPNHIVVTYVNTTAEVKALSDIVVTSTNAVGIINSIPKDQPDTFWTRSKSW